MKVIEDGDKVSITCEIRLEDGRVYFKNDKKNPIELVVGEGDFFPAVENELINMKEGETKEILLEPKDAFGPRMEELIVDVSKDVFPPNANIREGSRVKIGTPSGKIIYGTVIGVKENSFTIDLNHPLAGKRLIFVVTIVSIEKRNQ